LIGGDFICLGGDGGGGLGLALSVTAYAVPPPPRGEASYRLRCRGAVHKLGSPFGREPVKPAEVPLDGGELSPKATEGARATISGRDTRHSPVGCVRVEGGFPPYPLTFP
jgi:hypothetical protein